jgi:hypothetical protein
VRDRSRKTEILYANCAEALSFTCRLLFETLTTVTASLEAAYIVLTCHVHEQLLVSARRILNTVSGLEANCVKEG